MTDIRYILEKPFRDKKGRIVITQSPNLALFGWILFEIVSLILGKGRFKEAFQGLATASLFVWAYLETTIGVNLFRKLFGSVVMIIIILGYFIS